MPKTIHKKIAILGFGREGRAVLRFLQNSPRYRGAEIVIFDQNPNVKTPRGSRAILGKDALQWLHGFHLLFRSPGIPYLSPEIRHVLDEGAKCSSATKLFFDLSPCPIIGVTGTKGKGTTATLLCNILKAAGRDARLVGNIGTPALSTLPKLKKSSIAVFELSSFQLQDLDRSPEIAAVLDIFPDHMDAHGSFDEYREAKANIARRQTRRGRMFYFADNLYAAQIAETSRGKKYAVSPAGFALFSPDDLKTPGAHNFKNAVMAAQVARTLGISDDVILKAVKQFRGLPHRLELVQEIVRRDGTVRFYDDSAGTNPQTAAAAVRAFSSPLILIAGGKDKNLDYAPLRKAVAESPNVKLVVLIGENKNKIRAELEKTKNAEFKIVECATLADAVRAAYQFALNLEPRTSNAVIVFSPAASSFDMFRDYADRGEQFQKIVKGL